MKRRIILATCLFSIVAGSAGVALATPGGVDNRNNNVCVVFANNKNYHSTQYICVSTPNQ